MNRISYATLPERTITVTPSANAINPDAIANDNLNTGEPTLPANKVSNTQQPNTAIAAPQSVIPLWLIIVAVLGYIFWIMWLKYFYTFSKTRYNNEDVTYNNASYFFSGTHISKLLSSTIPPPEKLRFYDYLYNRNV